MTLENEDPLLEVKNLSTRFFTEEGQVNAVENVSFDVGSGEVFGIVGESGSGKTVTALSVINLVDSPGKITDGKIWYNNAEFAGLLEDDYPELVSDGSVDLRTLPANIQQILRGKYFSMIFQNPKDSFNKSYTVGDQIAEAVEVRRRIDAKIDTIRDIDYDLWDYLRERLSPRTQFVSEESFKEAIELLEKVGMPDPVARANEYPHQLSGGMLQRAMIAQALACDPDILVADEPTTALDVTIQSQILEVLNDLQSTTGLSIILITHDLGVVARTCDNVGVMYAGEIVEKGTLEDIFYNQVHPYTQGLLGSDPSTSSSGSKLEPIPGNVPNLIDKDMPTGCYFAERCPEEMSKCAQKPPDLLIKNEHTTKCYLAEEEDDTANQEHATDSTVDK